MNKNLRTTKEQLTSKIKEICNDNSSPLLKGFSLDQSDLTNKSPVEFLCY